MTAPRNERDELDRLLSIADVDINELLALVPALIAAGGEPSPQLVALLAKAAGVRASDDDTTAAQKIAAFRAANATNPDVERALFTLAAGKGLDVVKAGAKEAFEKFNDAGANLPSQSGGDGAKQGMSVLAARLGAPGTKGES